MNNEAKLREQVRPQMKFGNERSDEGSAQVVARSGDRAITNRRWISAVQRHRRNHAGRTNTMNTFPHTLTLRGLCLLALLLAATTAFADDPPDPPEVTNVDVNVRGNYVDITYDLYQAQGEECVVWPTLSKDGGGTYDFGVLTVSGDVGFGVAPGTGKRMTWNAYADYPGESIATAGIRLAAETLVTTRWYEQYPWFSDRGVVAYWPFDGDTLDYAGNENHATGTSTDAEGVFGQARHLHNTYLTVADHPSISSFTEMTMALWVNFEGFLEYNSSLMGKGWDGNDSFCLWSNGKAKIYFVGPYHEILVTSDFPRNQWLHFALTFDSDHFTCYLHNLQGQLLDQQTTSVSAGATIDTSGHPLYFGRHCWGSHPSSCRTLGRVTEDEAVIFNRALSADEIGDLVSDLNDNGVADFWE